MNERTGASCPDIFMIEPGYSAACNVTPDQAGNKAYGLFRMLRAGILVPPGFVLATSCCRSYFANGHALGEEITGELHNYVRRLEKITGRGFGNLRRPLLLSVRSGAPVSMPGMMETLLNIGLNDESVSGLIRLSGNPHMAWDSYRRLIQSYAEIIHGCDSSVFGEITSHYLKREGLSSLCDLDTGSMRALVSEFRDAFRYLTNETFPQDPRRQLEAAVVAVFDSWFSKRAIRYRELNNIDAASGTACLIQAMVFGNAGGRSGSGVGFTRNPSTGDNQLYVDFLVNAQGEDIVAGRHFVNGLQELAQTLPGVYGKLNETRNLMEQEFRDMQDFEFTVHEGELYFLQTRSGKRTPWAALKIAIDLVDEGIIEPVEALAQLNNIDLDNLQRYRFRSSPADPPVASGITASLGVASGMISLDENAAREFSGGNRPVILVRENATTEDINAMSLARGIVTVTGGRTSHAAVVARQMGIACVVGCRGLQIDLPNRCIRINGRVFREGEYLSVDADHGLLYAGRLECEITRPDGLLDRVYRWRENLEAKHVPICSVS